VWHGADSEEHVGSGDRPPAAADLLAGTGWLIRLRWLAVAGGVCLVEVARRVFPLRLALLPIHLTLAALAVNNVILTLILRRLRSPRRGGGVRPAGPLARLLLPWPVGEPGPPSEAFEAALFVWVQMAVDLLFLTLLLHLSGGIESPLVFFFVFHVILAAMLLSRLAASLHTTLGFVLVSAVALGELFGILPHYHLYGALSAGGYRDPTRVTLQMTVVGATLYLSAYIGSSIAGRLRARQRESEHLSRRLAEKTGLLETACRQAIESQRARSDYMRRVAHELRGPVGTIQTALKVVLDGLVGPIPNGSRELVERAERRAGDVAQVTEDLLTLSRAREAPVELELIRINPGELVAEVVSELSSDAMRAGVTLRPVIGRELGFIRADPEGLWQLVRNLVENAVRYTPRGGTVCVSLSRGQRGLRLEVKDSGIGIAEKDLPHVFDEFYRAANAREFSRDGTGLGLAIVRAVAEQHGGSVTIDSAPGRGTLVAVDLPLEPLAPKRDGLPERDTTRSRGPRN
jgi:signal transduction histidine kinase